MHRNDKEFYAWYECKFQQLNCKNAELNVEAHSFFLWWGFFFQIMQNQKDDTTGNGKEYESNNELNPFAFADSLTTSWEHVEKTRPSLKR